MWQYLLVALPVEQYSPLGLEALAGASGSERFESRLSDIPVEPLGSYWRQIVVGGFGLPVALGKEFEPGQGLDGLVVLVKLVARLRWEPCVGSSVGDDCGVVADRVRVGDECGHRLEGLSE